MAGRPFTPVAIRDNLGTNASKRPMVPDPTPPLADVVVPEWLESDLVAAAEYRRWGEKFIRLGVMTELDELALTTLAVHHAIRIKAATQLRGEDLVQKRGTGASCRNPLLDVIRDAEAEISRIMTAFGLTPSARAALQAKGQIAGEPNGRGMVDRVVAAEGDTQVDDRDRDDMDGIRNWQPPKNGLTG